MTCPDQTPMTWTNFFLHQTTINLTQINAHFYQEPFHYYKSFMDLSLCPHFQLTKNTFNSSKSKHVYQETLAQFHHFLPNPVECDGKQPILLIWPDWVLLAPVLHHALVLVMWDVNKSNMPQGTKVQLHAYRSGTLQVHACLFKFWTKMLCVA